MTTYSLPSGVHPQSFTWGLDRRTVRHESSITGSTQTVDLLSSRWVVDLNLPARDRRDSGAVEAFFNGLVGGVDRLALHRLDRPVPLGTMRGSPTLNAAVTQFSDTLVLAGAWDTSRQNLVSRSADFSNAAWLKVASVTAGAPSFSAPDGTSTACLITRTGASNPAVYRVLSLASDRRTWSCYFKAGTGAVVNVRIDSPAGLSAVFNLSTGVVVSAGVGVTAAISSAGGGWYRCSITVTAAIVNIVFALDSIAIGETIYAWGAQVNQGSLDDYIPTVASASYAPGTLNAGDMLGVGSQLFQVRTNATATSAGVLTVKTVNRTRVALSSGAAVTWDRPTALFAVQDGASAFSFGPGAMGASSFRLVEAY